MAAKKKSLTEMGCAQAYHGGFRARMKVNFRGVLHSGPTRRLTSEAAADLALFRAASSREEVGWIAQR